MKLKSILVLSLLGAVVTSVETENKGDIKEVKNILDGQTSCNTNVDCGDSGFFSCDT